MEKRELYDSWVNKVCRYIEQVGPEVDCCSSAMQSKPVLDRSPEVVFLGYNAHEPYPYAGVNRERFYQGNAYFYSERDKWRIWTPLYGALKWAGCPQIMDDGNFVFMNAVYFGTNTIADMKAKKNSADIIGQCLSFTSEVIRDIYKPKVVVCFSINDCFRPLDCKLQFSNVETIVPHIISGEAAKHSVVKGMWSGIKFIGIPHPSGRINYDDWGAIAMFLKKEIITI